MKASERKDPAAVALRFRVGKAGTGVAKRRGDAEYYRRLVSQRGDRKARKGVMIHRHLNQQDFTLAAIDDVIGRGQRPAWEALRLAVLERPEIQAKVLRVCAAHSAEPYAQRYHFWKHYVQAHSAVA